MTAPPIYVGNDFSPKLTAWPRLLAIVVAAGALAVLIIAAYLRPDPRGIGTHEGLGMQPCGFLQATGIPCMGCGMTTSFADAVRWRLLASFTAQPFGMVLCFMTAAAFWSAIYVAVTGRPAYRLLRMVPTKTHLMVWPTLSIAAWAWKIVLTIG